VAGEVVADHKMEGKKLTALFADPCSPSAASMWWVVEKLRKHVTDAAWLVSEIMALLVERMKDDKNPSTDALRAEGATNPLLSCCILIGTLLTTIFNNALKLENVIINAKTCVAFLRHFSWNCSFQDL
jgi:hypothetical protein